MKSLVIHKPEHKRLENAFKEWLELMGYAETSVYGMQHLIREFLHWMEQENKSLESLIRTDINTYFFHLSKRKKLRRQGAISIGYLHKHLQAVKRFSEYLLKTEQESFEVDIILAEPKRKPTIILSKKEIRSLYTICNDAPLGLRDRAMLGIYYGCGLRRNEGVNLDVSDYLKERSLLYVRKGKNYKERYVPLTKSVKQEIENYLYYGRSFQIKDPLEGAFFLSKAGNRIHGQTLQLRLKVLLEKAEIGKESSLHTLRHSIATHLLQSGMKLNYIANFLGHKSLESTQIYTHIINEL